MPSPGGRRRRRARYAGSPQGRSARGGSGESGLDPMREHHRCDVLDVVDSHRGAISCAASACAALRVTMSARCPSTSSSMLSAAMATRILRSTTTSESIDIARAIRSASACSRARNARRTRWDPPRRPRVARRSRRADERRECLDVDAQPEAVEQLRTELTSSGFIVPTRMKRDGCDTRLPHARRCSCPIAAASRSTSTM